MTVLPVRSTRVAPAGGWRSPFLPTHGKLSPSTRNAEFSIGALPSPTIRRAPSNNVAPPAPPWKAAPTVQARPTIKPTGRILDNDMNVPPPDRRHNHARGR